MANNISDPTAFKWCKGAKYQYSAHAAIYAHFSNKEEINKIVEYTTSGEKGLEVVYFEHSSDPEVDGIIRYKNEGHGDTFKTFNAKEDVLIIRSPSTYDVIPRKEFNNKYEVLSLKAKK